MARVLIVDDDEIIVLGLEEDLTELNHEIAGTAESCEEAIEIAKTHKPDLVLMDIKLHGEDDGIMAAKIIESETGIPVIFVTAYGGEQYLKKIQAVSPFSCLIKPYNKIELSACINIALYRKQIEVQLAKQYENMRLINNILIRILYEIDPYDKLTMILSEVRQSLDLTMICIYEMRDNSFIKTCDSCNSEKAGKDEIFNALDLINEKAHQHGSKELSMNDFTELFSSQMNIKIPLEPQSIWKHLPCLLILQNASGRRGA